MLIMTLTDVPRLLPAVFMGGDAPAVQIIGWITWLAAAPSSPRWSPSPTTCPGRRRSPPPPSSSSPCSP
ncbi:hypothetical protein ACFQVA_21130 [Actinomadura keratinilytica]